MKNDKEEWQFFFALQSCVYRLVSGEGLQFVVEEKITDMIVSNLCLDRWISVEEVNGKSINWYEIVDTINSQYFIKY